MRKEDISEKRKHARVVDRPPLEPPPIIVAIVGPPKVRAALSTYIYYIFYYIFNFIAINMVKLVFLNLKLLLFCKRAMLNKS